MSEKIVGVPTVRGMGSSFKDFGVGLLGGVIFLLAFRLFGILGVIAAPLIAGSMIKGERGQIMATMAGFSLVALAPLLAGAASNDSGVNNGVM